MLLDPHGVLELRSYRVYTRVQLGVSMIENSIEQGDSNCLILTTRYSH